MSDIKKTFDSLSSTNWGQWVDNMQAYLATKELWEYVDGSALKPVPADPDHPTASELKDLGDWKRKTARAGGELWLAIEDSQKVHVKELKGDPVVVWEKLRAVHLQQRPGARFNAYEALFSIRKQEDESLSDLMARADKAMQDIKALRPDKFTLDDLDKELLSMTLIHALPTEYNNFASSLLLLDSLDIDKRSRTSRVSAKLAILTPHLHPLLILPPHLLFAVISVANSATSRKTASKRPICPKERRRTPTIGGDEVGEAEAKVEARMRRKLFRKSLAVLQKSRLQPMQVLSPPLIVPNGCRVEHHLTGTPTQAPLHT